MFIVLGMTPATENAPAFEEVVASFETASEAQELMKMFNPLPEQEKKALRRKSISVGERDIKISKVYTVMYAEER